MIPAKKIESKLEPRSSPNGKPSTPPTADASMMFDGAPMPLGELGDHPPPFPVDALPDALANFVRAVAESVQVPTDLVGIIGLAVAAGGVARKFIVNADGSEWYEPLNLFAAAVADPGERKSAILRLVLKPVQELECEEIERMCPIVAAAAAEKETLNQRLKQLQTKVAKADDAEERAEGMREIQILAREIEEFQVPALPTYIVDDETQESVGKTLAQNCGRLFQAGAEGTLFSIVGGRYADGENFDVYLKGHAGDPLICGRTSRERYRVERPALTCALLVQPEVLRKIGTDNARGLGFLGRWLYAVPSPMVGFRRVATTPIPATVQESYAHVIRMLWSWRADDEEAVLKFDPTAANLLLDWRGQIEQRLRPDGDLRPLGAWGSKLVGATVRIAGVCHLVEAAAKGQLSSPAPISPDSLESATRITESYLIPHAFLAFGLMAEPPGEPLARRILGWLSRKSEITTFTERQAFQQHKSARGDCRTVSDIKPAIELLIAHGFVSVVPTPRDGGPGRGGSPLYVVNPSWPARREKLPQIPRNSILGESGEHFVKGRQ